MRFKLLVRSVLRVFRPVETDRDRSTGQTRAAILGNPLFLVKARMQAYSPFNPVGAQHHYTSALNGLVDIVRKEGVKGLARGVDAAMLRTAMGSSVQLPSYNLAKTTLSGWGVGDHAGLFLVSSIFSGLCVCTVMQPAGASLITCTRDRLLGLRRHCSVPLTCASTRRYRPDADVQPIAQLDRSRWQTARASLSVLAPFVLHTATLSAKSAKAAL